MSPKHDPKSECQRWRVRSIALFDLFLVQGALDSLGIALADRSHQWTDGERAIYEEATDVIRNSCGDCMETDLLASEIYSLGTQPPGLMPRCDLSSLQLALSGCSPWRVASLLGRLLASMLYRRLLVFCSYFMWGDLRGRLISLSNRQLSHLPKVAENELGV